jgi:predicted RNA-binding protein with PUA-like domain
MILRTLDCLDNRLTVGGKDASPTYRPRSTPQKHYFSASDTHFCYRLRKTQGLVRLKELGKLKKSIHFIASRIRYQPTSMLFYDKPGKQP